MSRLRLKTAAIRVWWHSFARLEGEDTRRAETQLHRGSVSAASSARPPASPGGRHRFRGLDATSLMVMPAAIIWMCLTIRRVSRLHVLAVGLLLVAIAGIDIYLLQALKRLARETPSTADNVIFDSEITVGLYVLPALLAGIGVNIASHVVIQHLSDGQRRFDGRGRSD